MKFIKIDNKILNVGEIKSIYTYTNNLVVVCTDKSHSFGFSSQKGATEELNKIYKQLEEL